MYTPESIRKNSKSSLSEPAKFEKRYKSKRNFLDFAEREKVIHKVKVEFTEDKLAFDLGT